MLHMLVAACCLITGRVHTPSDAPIAQAQLVFSAPGRRVRAASDARGSFSVTVPPGRYTLSATAAGYVPVTVTTGEIGADARIDVVLESVAAPSLRTIGQVTVNGAYALQRNAIPETDVSRATMDQLGYQQTIDALKQIPSVIVQPADAGSPTSPQVVSLRGPDPSEALVTLDGQQLNDGNTGDVDLSQFAVAAFSSVNVTEGLGPNDLEGSNTFGGAVNLISLRPTQQPHASLSGSLGSFGTSQSFLNATGTLGKLGYAVAGNWFNQAGQTNETAFVVPVNDAPVYCGSDPAKTPNCPQTVHLGSTIFAQLGLVNLDYNFSQRSDVDVRLFSLGNRRDESAALNGIAGNATCALDGTPGPACDPGIAGKPGAATAINPVYGFHIGAGSATLAQTIRAYDLTSRSVLGSGSLIANVYAGDNNVDFEGGGASPYDVSHVDRRYNEGLTWGRSFEDGEFSFGGYARQESLAGLGITSTLAQSIDSYFVRGAQRFGNLRLSAGLYDSWYSSFGDSVNWRLGASYDLDPATVVRFDAGTGFRAPLLAEKYYFQPVYDATTKTWSTPGLGPPDQNCVVAGQGNPDERAEHATEYELGLSHRFSPLTNLDVSFYRSNLRDTIENYYPGGGSVSYCNNPKLAPLGFVYEIPINIGNAVYEGAEARFRQGFPKQHLTVQLAYGLNVAYPYALGPNVSNPTSGGNLVPYEQFLSVPQQQGSATLVWAERGFHAATAFTFAGRNNTLNQPPYTLTDVAVGKDFGVVDFTISATNIFNAVSGPFTYYNAGTPYRGLYAGPGNTQYLANLPTDQLHILPAAFQFRITVHQ